jgi:hypothetical protein
MDGDDKRETARAAKTATCVSSQRTQRQVAPESLLKWTDGETIHTRPVIALIRPLAGVDVFRSEKGLVWRRRSASAPTCLRLQLSATDPFAITSQETLVADAGLFANGIKYRDNALY